MRFKLLGVVLLGVGLYLVAHGIAMARAIPEAGVAAQVYCLAAIFLAITVRVLQAERHHRMAIKPPQFVRTTLPPLPDHELHIEDFEEILGPPTTEVSPSTSPR
jgi:hypothetical protein